MNLSAKNLELYGKSQASLDLLCLILCFLCAFLHGCIRPTTMKLRYKEEKMFKHPPRKEVMPDGEPARLSRRNFLNTAGVTAAGGLLVAAGGNLLAGREAAAATAPTAPPLPWKYAKLDPAEAGKRAYKFYHEKGG